MESSNLTTSSGIHLEITSALATVLRQENSDRIVIEKKVARGTTIGDLLADLAADLSPEYKDFHLRVYNPETGEVSDQVMIILNDTLLQFPHVTNTELSNGDEVMLAVVFGGG